MSRPTAVHNYSVLIGAAILASAALPLPAAVPWPLPLFSSEPKAVLEAADGRPTPASAGLIVLDYQCTVRFLANGQTRRLQRTVYRVVNASGVSQLSNISQTWLAWRTEKPIIRARVISRDATAHVLDPATITEAGVPTQLEGQFSDLKILTAPLPAVAEGAIVEAEIENDDRETVNPGGALERITLAGRAPIQYLHLTIEAPAGVPLHIEERRLPKLERSEASSGGVHRVELSTSDVSIAQPVLLAPPEAAGGPTVLVSQVPDWQQVAKWYSGVAERQIGIESPAVDADADPVNRLPEIEAILAAIQKAVRYTGVELGFAAFEPRQPAETSSRGYGDCKDKAALLVSRLRAAGIASTLALLTQSPSADVSPEVPGLEAFTHAIVYVPGKHPLWIDPTAEFAPARRLPWTDQGRLALIVDPRTRELTRTPESGASDETGITTLTLTLSGEGKARADIVRDDSGGMEDYLRPLALTASQAPENRRESMLGQFYSRVPGGKLSVDWGTPRDLSKPSRIAIHAEGWPGTGLAGEAVYANVDAMGELPAPLVALWNTVATEKDEPEAKERTLDYYLPAAFTSEDRMRVIPPPGFRLKQLPQVGDLPFGPLTIRRRVSMEADGSVLFTYRTEGDRRFTPAQAKSFLAAVEGTGREPFHLEFMAEGSRLMSEGKWKEGIEQLRLDAASEPPGAQPLLRYASALLEAGFRDEAITICRKAIGIDPKSAAAYARLSFLYRHDPLGRLDGHGKDVVEAEKAIRKAMELDPDDKRLVADLATILEWKDPEERFADVSGVEESIKLLNGISKDLPGLQDPDQLPQALFYARRFAELQAFYSGSDRTRWRADLRVAAVAAADGPAAGLREAAKLFPDSGDNRKAVIQGAGRFLMRISEYSKAADMLQEGTGANSIPQSDFELLRRTRRASEIKLSTNGVIAAVQGYILALCDPHAGRDYSELLTPEWKFLTLLSQRKALETLLSPFARVGGERLWTRAVGEIVVSNVEFVPEGNDAYGYRVRFADPSQGGARKTIAWVVKRGAAYRILGLRGGQATSAGEALALATNGHLTDARRWLDWEREEIAVPSSADPLAGEPFIKLWPMRAGVPERDQVLAAAASLVMRGHYYKLGVEVLSDVRARAHDRSFQDDLDLALASGLSGRDDFAEALPVWRRMNQQHPDSGVAFNALGAALVRSGQAEDALRLARLIKPDDPLYATAQRVRARALQTQHKYAEAVQAYQEACNSPKATASDWNNRAWLTLFAPGVLAPGQESARTAVRLTQSRSPAEIHTLGSILAETGQLKEARQMLMRYLAFYDATAEINDSARYLEARIAEQLGLRDTAQEIYTQITAPKIDAGDSTYQLAQLRLKALIQGH